MTQVISVTGNTVQLNSAQNVHQAKYVLVSVTGSTARTITVANTTAPDLNGRSRVGSVTVSYTHLTLPTICSV